jgi:hypothetical protein
MATEKYQVLVEIGIDSKVVKDSIANADRLTAEINKLRAAQKESGIQDAETTAAIKALTQERSRDLRVIQQANSLASETVKGQERLKAELSLLTVQYNNLTTEEQRNTAAGQKMGSQIRALSNELKANESAVGNNARNVGNYTDSIKEALVSITGAVPGLSGFKNGLDGVTNGFKAAGGGVKGFGAALMTLGLPLIIAGVSALVGVLKSFKPVADAVEESVTALKAAFGALISGGSITEAVKQSRAMLEVMRDLEDSQKAFAISAQKYSNEIAKLIVASKDRTKTDQERLAIVARANQLEEEYFNASVDRINRELSARESEFLRKNKITQAELDLLAEGTSKQALALRERLEKGAEYNEEELGQLQDLLAERAKLEGESLVLQEKLANRTNQLQDEMAKDRQAMADKVAEATEKANEARKKELEKQQAIAAKEIEDAQKQAEAMKAITDEFARSRMSEYDRQMLELEERTAQLKKAGVDEVEITKWVNETLANMDKAKKSEQMARDAEAFSNYIELIGQREQLEIQAAEASIEGEQELANAKAKIAIDFLQQRLAIMREQAMLDDLLTQNEINNLKLVEGEIARIQDKLANPDNPTFAQAVGLSEQDFEAMQAGMQVAQDVLGAIQAAISANAENRIAEIDQQSNAEIEAIKKSGLSEEEKDKKIMALEQKAAKEKYKIELEQFKSAKAISIIMAVISTAQAVIAAFTAGSSLGPAGVVAGPVMAGVAGALGAVQIGLIAAQQPPSPPAFASGGYVSGAGSGTSDSIPAYLSNGESVNNAETTRRFAPLLSAMNAAGGGVDWYRGEGYSNGGLVRKFAAGGVASVSSSQVRESEQMAMVAAQMAMSQPVLVLEEFQSVQGRQVRTEQNLQL